MSVKSFVLAKDASLDYQLLDAARKSITNQILDNMRGTSSSNKQITKTFRALSGLNFEFESGARVGIWGPNGAGKSSLLRMLAGIYSPTHGEFRSSGRVASLIDINLGIMPDATGRENILIRGLLWGMTKKEIAANFESIVAVSELEKFIDLPLRTYSTGMQMRLSFAVAMHVKADILLMDEWLAVGDEAFQNKAEKLLHEKVAESELFFIASHSKDLLAKVTEQILILDSGVIKKIATSKEFLDSPT